MYFNCILNHMYMLIFSTHESNFIIKITSSRWWWIVIISNCSYTSQIAYVLFLNFLLIYLDHLPFLKIGLCQNIDFESILYFRCILWHAFCNNTDWLSIMRSLYHNYSFSSEKVHYGFTFHIETGSFNNYRFICRASYLLTSSIFMDDNKISVI